MRHCRRSFLIVAAATAALLALPPFAGAETYPAHPVRVIVPFPAGGPTDVLVRLYGQKLSQRWGQPVVIENRPGATGTIGTEVVVRSPPDGYTLLFTVDLPITMVPALLEPRYDSNRDLVPIAAVANIENLLVVNPSSGVHSLAELVAAAKAKPGALTFASAGSASPGHLCGEMLKKQASIDMTHVPYTGAAPAMNAVLAGDVTMFCGPIPLGMNHVKAGALIALGVTGASPSALAPGIAPLSATYPGLVISNWNALFAPAGTPAAVTQWLQDELKAVYADSELREKLAALGLIPAWQSGAELSHAIENDAVKWHDFVKAANIKAQ